MDVKEYALFIIDLMGKLCAPVRDEEVATLKSHLNNLVELFKNIMKVLDNMKLDMANFTIQQARPLIVSQSVEYEKTKFKEFLNTQDDGLKFTREWLQRHRPRLEELEANEDARFKKLLANRILTEAFVELLEWDYDYHGWPGKFINLKMFVIVIALKFSSYSYQILQTFRGKYFPQKSKLFCK